MLLFYPVFFRIEIGFKLGTNDLSFWLWFLGAQFRFLQRSRKWSTTSFMRLDSMVNHVACRLKMCRHILRDNEESIPEDPCALLRWDPRFGTH